MNNKLLKGFSCYSARSCGTGFICRSVILFIIYTCSSYPCTASHRLFKGGHKIRGIKLNVELSPNPPKPPQEQDPVLLNYTEKKPPTIDDRDDVRSSNSAGTPLATSKSTSKEPSTFSVSGRGCSVGIASVVGGKQEHQQSSLRESPHTGRKQSHRPHRVIAEQPKGQPDMHKPTHIGSTSKDRNPNYITVSGLNDSISTDDIVAHFQTAQCGGGTVTEVIYLGQSRSKALVGISGIELDCKFTRKSCYCSSTSQYRYCSCPLFKYYALQQQLNQFQHPNQISFECNDHC